MVFLTIVVRVYILSCDVHVPVYLHFALVYIPLLQISFKAFDFSINYNFNLDLYTYASVQRNRVPERF